jgi:NSS family neurotransmitter:Na+ symporter
MSGLRAQWGSRLAFILAATGSAVGLGNIWKFPYIAGEYGGGAFVLVYLVCIAAVGIPIFIAELYIGKKAQSNTVAAFDIAHKPGSPWKIAGWLGLASAFVILSFYSVVGGWVLNYVYLSVTDKFAGLPNEQISQIMGDLFANGELQLMWHTIFMFLVTCIVAKGLKGGLERWNKILMPGLLILLGVLFVKALMLPGISEAINFMFAPDASKLSAKAIVTALGHAFFTLSLGMGAMITYGSYLSKKEDLVKTAIIISFMDTLIAVVAGIVIFSVVFTYGAEPGAGPSLMFKTLPMLFVQMAGGYWFSLMFFVLVSFAAFTSAVSLLEVVVAYGTETKGFSRVKTSIVISGIIYVLGLLSVFSYNHLNDVKVLGLNFLDLFDQAASNYMLPIGGLLIALCFGWGLGKAGVDDSVGDRPAFIKTGLLWTVRIIAPLGVAAMIVNTLIEKFG